MDLKLGICYSMQDVKNEGKMLKINQSGHLYRDLT